MCISTNSGHLAEYLRADIHFYTYAGIRMARMKTDKNAPVSVLALLDERPGSRTSHYEEEWNGFWQFCNVMQFNRSFTAASTVGLDQHAYVALDVQTIDAATMLASSASLDGEAWSEIREMLFDDEAKRMADLLEEKGIPAPDDAGVELTDNSGMVFAEVELVWTERKIGYMTEDHQSERAPAERAGWRIFMAADEIDRVFEEG